MKKILLISLLFIICLRPASAQTAVSTHPIYQLMTFPIDIDSSRYRNPFDAQDIELVGVFQAPSGRQVIIPGFWMQPYVDQCHPPCLIEDLQPVGDPTWQVRFAPDEVGHWTYNLQVRDDGTTVKVERGEFDTTASANPGFIHVSPNRRYFRYDNGQSYFPIGHNLQWSWEAGGGLVAYRQWLQQLSDAGGNYARLLIDDPWFIGLEWNSAAGDYRASQKEAARLDAILGMAAEYGISLQIIIQWHQALINYQGVPVVIPDNPPRPDMSADWDNYGYNIANGGPLTGPGVFFYDDRAKTLFRQRLRYIAARWGYSPQIFAWEVIDEIDRTANYDASVASGWLQEMAGYLREVDQRRHLITAGSRNFDPTIVSNPLLDFTQARFYQRRPFQTVVDQVVGSLNAIRADLNAVRSPTLLTDFSLNPWFEPSADDPQGISVQTTLWASAFSGAGGGAISAWGETYIAPLHLQRYYPPLAAFASLVDWANLNLQPAEAALLSDDPALYKPLRISGFNRHSREPGTQSVEHVITPDGVLPDVTDVSSYIYGQTYNRQLNQPQRYRLTVSQDTYFEVRVRATSAQAGAHLVVNVDGRDAADLLLNANMHDVGLRVPLAVGEHTITLNNTGDDWLELDYLEVGQFIAPVRVLTLRDSQAGVALSWLQNRTYTWDKIGQARSPLLLRYRLDQLPAGDYAVEIWNPLSGAVIGQELTTVGADGVLQVDLVPMSDELALRAVLQFTPESVTPTPFSIVTNTPVPTPQTTSTQPPAA